MADRKCQCGMPLDETTECSCQPGVCCYCCTCQPDCECGCQQKKAEQK
ncbi:MAG TPA: hypothetical protein P5089_02805 [Candidatus Portnoybacteria bacterium]|nr:hypothetical protein [Candidatus Portnoybacteria bacterium]